MHQIYTTETLTGLLIIAALFIWRWAGERDKKISVLYGYPKYSKKWLNIYYRRGKDEWIFEWDDLFDSGRPASWGHISECLMFFNKDSGANEDEAITAWALLQKRGLA